MTLVVILTTGLLLVAIAGVWLVAHRAVSQGRELTAERIWESFTRFVLVVPSLAEQAIDEGRTWLRGARSRVLSAHHSLSWLIIGSTLGAIVWAGIAYLAATMDVLAFDLLEFSNPLGLGLAVAVGNSVVGSLFADVAGWTRAWPFPPVNGSRRAVLLTLLGVSFAGLLALQGALGAVRADHDLATASLKIDQRGALAGAAAAGIESEDTQLQREQRVAEEHRQLDGRWGRQKALATAVPMVVGLLEALLSIALLYALRLALALPAAIGGAALWLLRFPIFLVRQVLTYGLRLVMDLFSATHGMEPRPVETDDQARGDLPTTGLTAVTEAQRVGRGADGAGADDDGAPQAAFASATHDDPLWNPL